MTYAGQSYGHWSGMPDFSDESLGLHLKFYEGFLGQFNRMIDGLNGTQAEYAS